MVPCYDDKKGWRLLIVQELIPCVVQLHNLQVVLVAKPLWWLSTEVAKCEVTTDNCARDPVLVVCTARQLTITARF
jgi:hypothetical protein